MIQQLSPREHLDAAQPVAPLGDHLGCRVLADAVVVDVHQPISVLGAGVAHGVGQADLVESSRYCVAQVVNVLARILHVAVASPAARCGR